MTLSASLHLARFRFEIVAFQLDVFQFLCKNEQTYVSFEISTSASAVVGFRKQYVILQQSPIIMVVC
jgi:hypothetical protein